MGVPVNPWSPIAEFWEADYTRVDLWLHVYACPSSMGISDGWRVAEAHRVNGKWFHLHNGEQKQLESRWITHWMPCPEPPEEPVVEKQRDEARWMRDKAMDQVAELKIKNCELIRLLRGIYAEVTNGRLCHFGDHTGYTPQFSSAQTDRWVAALEINEATK